MEPNGQACAIRTRTFGLEDRHAAATLTPDMVPPSGNDPEPPVFQTGAQTIYATTACRAAGRERSGCGIANNGSCIARLVNEFGAAFGDGIAEADAKPCRRRLQNQPVNEE